MNLKLLICALALAAVLLLNAGAPSPSDRGETDYVKWFDHYLNDWTDFNYIYGSDAFEGAVFTANPGGIALRRGDSEETVVFGMPVWNAYFADLNGDGCPELLASVSFGSGIVDEHVVVYDVKNDQTYTLWERGVFDYVLSDDGGVLSVLRSEYNTPYLSGEYHKGVWGRLRLTKDEPAVLLFEEW